MQTTTNSTSKNPPRVVFLGSGAVGKTSITNRFIYNTFDERYRPTVEDIFNRTFEFGNYSIELDFMDTGGTYNFTAMRRISMSTGAAFVLVFAQNDRGSFLEVQGILEELKMEREDFGYFPLSIVCNKSDIPTLENDISESEITNWLITMNLKPTQFICASAKTGDKISDIFRCLWIQNFQAITPIKFTKIDNEQTGRIEGLSLLHTNSSSFLQLHDYNNKTLQDEFSTTSNEISTEGGSKLNRNLFRSSLKLKRKSTKKKRTPNQNIVTLNCKIS